MEGTSNKPQESSAPKRLLQLGKTGADNASAENTPRDIVIRDITGAETDVVWSIVGKLSDRYRKAQRRLKEMSAKERKSPSQATIERRLRELNGSVVVAWKARDGGPGVTDPSNGNVPVPCTLENVMQILEENEHIHDQLVDELEDHGAFFQSSSRS
jgi:hypothetical protein